MQKSRRHHVVPKFILKNFAKDGRNIFVYNKKENKIYMESIKNSFVQKDLYSYKKYGCISDELEKNFSKVESKFSNIYKFIEDNNSLFLINKKSILDEFFYTCVLRSPRINQYARKNPVYLYMEQLLRILFPPEHFIKLMSMDNIYDIKYRILIHSLLRGELRKTKRYIWNLKTFFFTTERSFICSNAVFICSRKFKSIIIPISRNIIFAKGNFPASHEYRFINLDTKKTREINLEIFNDRFSYRIGSHSKELLNSLKSPR